MLKRHPNWNYAEFVLAKVAAGAQGFGPDLIPGLTTASWRAFPIDGVDPAVVTRSLLEYCRTIASGPLIMVTFQSFQPHAGPFFLDMERMESFFSEYVETYEDVPVAGDLILVAPQTGVVVVVHHNGLITTLHGSTFC